MELASTRLTSGGRARPLVVLGPSLGTSSEVLWEPVVDLLGGESHLVAWDLPGHGRSAPTSDGFALGDLADAVRALIDDARETLDITGPVVHAGVSLGGATGLHLALRHPAAVDGVAVICSGPALGTPQAWHERAAAVRAEGTGSLVEASAGRWFAPGFTERKPAAARRLLDGLREVGDESYARCCEALAGHDVTSRLSEITDPVLAVAGQDDAVAPPALAQTVAEQVRTGRALTLAGVAHLAPTEDPTATADALRGLIASLTSPTSQEK